MDKIKNNKRVFIGLIEIAGYYTNLYKGFKEIGIDAGYYCINHHKFNYTDKSDNSNVIYNSLKKLITIYTLSKSKFKKILTLLGIIPLFFIFIIYSILKYDVFIFGFGKSFLPYNLDLPILKLLNKKIIFMFNGSDSRPPYINNCEGQSIEQIYLKIKKMKRQMDRINKYSSYIINHRLSAHFHSRDVVDVHKIGVPYKNIEYKNKETNRIKPIILHSPSNPIPKGTALILEVINELKSEYDFEFVEIRDKTNAEVLLALQGCDFVVDQMYSDTPLAGLATEAAWFGRPSIVGGYELKELKELMKPEERAPSYQIYPSKEELKKAIIIMIENKELRQEIGRKAKEFVHNQWSAKEVAKRYLDIINDNVPEHMIFNPSEIDFVHGAGVSDKKRKKIISELISKYGIESLQLSKHKRLDKIILSSLKL